MRNNTRPTVEPCGTLQVTFVTFINLWISTEYNFSINEMAIADFGIIVLKKQDIVYTGD